MTNLADLPDKTLLRPDEVAKFFSVKVRAVYNWISSGKIEGAERIAGSTIRIPRESVLKCRVKIEDEGLEETEIK